MTAYDIRLCPNFKLFLSGSSGCGKTTFLINLLENISTFTHQKIEVVIYVYNTYQTVFSEMNNLVNVFIKDSDELMSELENFTTGAPTFIIFDDLLNSKRLPEIAQYFVVDGRHKNLSLAYTTQKMFINNDYFRQISNNCTHFIVFKNVRNLQEIKTLASQLTPGKKELIEIYQDACRQPYSYLVINLTQANPDEVKYLSNLFDYDHFVTCYRPS